MSWNEDTSRNVMVGAVFAAIMALIVCAAYLTQSKWRSPEKKAGQNIGFFASAFASERR